MLQKWIVTLQQAVMKENGYLPDSPQLGEEVEQRIYTVASEMRGLVHGFDFAKVLAAYWNGHKLGEDELKQDALRWLRGEFATRTESRNALGVGVIIDDDNWYDYMKLWAEFTAAIGYKGLLLFIDEGVNLYKITNSVSRQSNYEKLLTMFNDTMQGKAEHLGIFIGGTPQFVEDHRRGLFSYEALRSRLAAGRYGNAASNNFSGPIIPLEMLSSEEILVLLQKLRDIHAMHYEYTPQLTDDQLLHFMQEASSRLGADELLTPRELVRDFMDLLHTLQGSPGTTFESLVGERKQSEGGEQSGSSVDDLLAEFEL
ncbi:hypothetical protein D3C71_1192210 [compost metagenome]